LDDIIIYGNDEGFKVDGSSQIKMRSSTINASTSYGVIAKSTAAGLYNVWLENCSISNPDSVDIGVDDNSVVFLVNITVPYEKVEFVDSFSKIALFWYVDLYVLDMFDQPAANANVTVKQASGQTVTYQSDNDGYIKWLLLHDKTMLEVGNLSSNPYLFSAVLGNHSGSNNTNIDMSKTVTVELENKAPSALNVQLTPSSPSTLDDLSVAFSYSDPENDPSYPYTIQWFADGVEQPAIANQTAVSSANTQKGQNWYAKVTVYDGAAYSISVDSNIITVQNSKPVASGVLISPSSPSSTTNISVGYSFSDDDDDNEGDTLVTWLVDRGSGFGDSGLSGTTLYYSQTKKGEKWKARVLPHDGEEYGSGVESNELAVGNSQPSALAIKIMPEEPINTQGIYVVYTFFDIDDDAEGASTFKWYRDTGSGFNLASGLTSTSVPADKTSKGEIWKCEYTPHDGTDFGATIISEPVTIGNSPPVVSNIIISPTEPSKYSELSVNYTFSDPDGDPEDKNTTIIKWFVKKKGVVGFAFYSNDLTIPGTELTKGDEWMCEIKPSDGEDAGNFTQSPTSIFVLNAPPMASELTITPSDPRQGMALTANYKYFDIDADLEDTDQRTILWYRDGENVADYDNMISLPLNIIRKGETWHFTLRPHDGEAYGSGQTSPSFTISGDVVIGNTAPVVNGTFINPTEPASSDNLTAEYNYFDIDGDELAKVEIHWFRNEVHIESFNNLLLITKEMTFKGDVWYFKIRVFDGLAYSDWITSPPKLVVNTPPAITFFQPDLLTPEITENDKLTFLIDASDPDKDELDYFWFVNGKIENLGKAFALETDYDSERWYLIRIEVSDGSEKVEMAWNVSVTDDNRPPTITIQTPEGKKDIDITTLESQEFIIITDDVDAEDEELDITWYLDDHEVLTGEDRYVYQPSDTSAGGHEVSVEVTDGKDIITESWNITVTKEEKEVKLEGDKETIAGQSLDFWGLLIAIISGIAAAVMFLFGMLRVKRKKGKLKEYMDKIEAIKESDERASGKEKELTDLKKQVKHEFSEGTVSENHYIILEREIDDALGDVRTDMVGKSVSKSSRLHNEVEKILADGIVTKREYMKAKRLIESSDELTVAEKRELDEMMENWSREHEDKPERRRPDREPKKPPRRDVIEDEDDLDLDSDDEDAEDWF
jgi:hypothetical protein